MKHVLLIWDLIPDSTEVYLIPEEEAAKHIDFLDQAHGKFINSNDSNNGMRFLNTALISSEDGFAEEGFESYRGIWAKYKVDYSKALTGLNVTAVYNSGFVL